MFHLGPHRRTDRQTVTGWAVPLYADHTVLPALVNFPLAMKTACHGCQPSQCVSHSPPRRNDISIFYFQRPFRRSVPGEPAGERALGARAGLLSFSSFLMTMMMMMRRRLTSYCFGSAALTPPPLRCTLLGGRAPRGPPGMKWASPRCSELSFFFSSFFF